MFAGAEGVSTAALSEYLDKHLDGPFEAFIDNHFEGTPFITEILKTAHRYYLKEKLPVIRKALKLVLAYNLTLHVTMVEQQGDENEMYGFIDDEESKFHGKTAAPVMINFQIKCALADMWRELQKRYSGGALSLVFECLQWRTIEELAYDIHACLYSPGGLGGDAI